MTDSLLKVGDVVSLRSGGPHMTVMMIADDISYCMWFEGDRSCTGMFRINTLQKVPEAGSTT